MKRFLFLACIFLAACQPATPPVDVNEEPAIEFAICEGEEQFGMECVSECPEGYDSFAAQLGTYCVRHYGQEELRQLPACQTANDCANSCGYATHATTGGGQLLMWGDEDERGLSAQALRCIPRDYEEFLIHTAGFTSVDENGEVSTVIA